MQFEHVITKSSPEYVLKVLAQEASGVVVSELATVLVAAQARSLAEQCRAELPSVQEQIVSLEKDVKGAQKAADKARSEHAQAVDAENKSRRERGLGERALLIIAQQTREAARQLSDAEALVRIKAHDLRLAKQKARNLELLSDGLGSYEAPRGELLPLLSAAMGVNGR